MKTFTVTLLFLFLSYLGYTQVLDSIQLHSEVIIYFASDESILTDDDRTKILELINTSKSLNAYKFLIDAHTDDVGNETYNLQLSERRKASVVSFLESQHIPLIYINSNYHGESKRVVSQEDEASRKLNRRVVIQLLIPEQKEQEEQIYLRGTIVSEDSKNGIPAQIQLRSKDFESKVTTDSLGRFKILSPVDASVVLEVVAKDHFIASKTLKITERHSDINLKVPLSKIEAGKKFSLKNMLFVGNKSIMLPTSFKALEHLKRFMTANGEQCIEIGGHVNVPHHPKLKKDTYDYQLSVARALEVHDELVGIGVDSTRLLARGYGNWQMIYPKALKEEQMKFNRRVEVVISKCDSTALLKNHSIPNRKHFRDKFSTRPRN